MAQPSTHTKRGFEGRLALMLDLGSSHRHNNKISQLLKAAKLKLQSYQEDIDYSHPRGLQKSQLVDLLRIHRVQQQHNVLITGTTGCGKIYLG